MSGQTLHWYFDFVSPFAYLQSCRLERRIDRRHTLVCHPVLLAAILEHWGQLGPAEIEPKRELTYRHVVWRAARDGFPLRMPPAHPFNPLPLLRLSIAAGGDFRVVRRIFDWVWCEGRLPDGAAGVEALASELNVTDWSRRVADAEIKDALRRETAAAIAAGVFGVPTVIVAGRLFWGDDLTEMLFEFCNAPDLFDRPSYASLAELPHGVRRRPARSQ